MLENKEKKEDKTSKNKAGLIQILKFIVFEASAGLIQFISFTLMKELLLPAKFMQEWMNNSATFAKIMTNEYGPIYLVALILSVIWSFTFNRKYTFKSAANVPIAMLEVLGYYAVFTPISTILGNIATANVSHESAIYYLVLIVTMIINGITEFIFEKFVVFRKSKGTLSSKEIKNDNN